MSNNNETDQSLPTPDAKPLGRRAGMLGGCASDALYDLCDVPTSWAPEAHGRWVTSDRLAFDSWLSIEDETLTTRASLNDEASQELIDDILHDFHVALPYDEAEQWWLFEAVRETEPVGRLKVIRNREAIVVASGLRHVIYGRELLRRWWSWRRGVDQFAGQSSVELACEALRTLIETTAPDLGLPETYQTNKSPIPEA